MSVTGIIGVNMMIVETLENLLKVWFCWSFFSLKTISSTSVIYLDLDIYGPISISIYNILNPTCHPYSWHFAAGADAPFVTKIMQGEAFLIVSSQKVSAVRFRQQNYLVVVRKRSRMMLQKHLALNATNATTYVFVCCSQTLLSWVKVWCLCACVEPMGSGHGLLGWPRFCWPPAMT